MPNNNSVGSVYLDVEANAKPFQQQINSLAGSSAGMLTSAFGKMSTVIAGAFSVGKIIQFGKESINLASDLAEVQNVVDVTFGASSQIINNFAKTAITQYGLSELSAKQYASTMGAMLKSMGLSQSAVVDMSQSITALSGDLASFYNLSSEDAFYKIRAGISGETEPLKQLGINMSVVNLESFAMSQGINKAYKNMSQSEQALLRYNYLLSVTSDAQGDFARTSDGWANQTRILKEQWNGVKSVLGSAFLSALAPVVKMLNGLIARLQVAANYFKAFVEAVTGIKTDTGQAATGMEAIGDEATAAGEATEKAAKKAKGALAGFDKLNVLSSSGSSEGGAGGASSGNPFGEIPEMSNTIPPPDTTGVEDSINKVKSLFENLKSYITGSFAPSIKSWGNAFTNLKEPIKQAFESIKLSTKSLWDNSLAPFSGYLLEDWIPNIANSFSETFAPIFTDVMSFAIGQFASDFEFACTQISNFTNDLIKPALDSIKNIFTDVMSIIRTEWEESGNKILELFGGVRDSFKEIWETLYNSIIKPVWDNIIESIDTLWDKHLKGLWEHASSFFSSLAEAVMTVWNNFLAPIVNWLVEHVGPVVTNFIQDILARVWTFFGIVSDVCSGIFQSLGGLLDFITGVFTGDWKKAWEGLKDFISGIWNAIWGIIKGIINRIIDGLNTLWSSVYRSVAGIINNLGEVAGTVGDVLGKDWKFGIPTKPPLIPKLARGGIINQPTLAMVGEAGKEAVVPLENTAFADSIANAILKVLTPLLRQNSSMSSSSDEPMVVVLKVGEYELGRVTVKSINKYHAVNGKIELEV